MLEKMKLRSVIRPQAGIKNGCSLYFYAAHADTLHAQAHLIQLLRQKEPELQMVDMTAEHPYRSERDAMRLLRKMSREYEPNILEAWVEGKAKSMLK